MYSYSYSYSYIYTQLCHLNLCILVCVYVHIYIYVRDFIFVILEEEVQLRPEIHFIFLLLSIPFISCFLVWLIIFNCWWFSFGHIFSFLFLLSCLFADIHSNHIRIYMWIECNVATTLRQVRLKQTKCEHVWSVSDSLWNCVKVMWMCVKRTVLYMSCNQSLLNCLIYVCK